MVRNLLRRYRSKRHLYIQPRLEQSLATHRHSNPGRKADADNPDPGTNGAKYLYFGEGICKKFYDKGNNHYELTTDFVSSWGFLIRTSNDPSWPAGTKYGATSASHKVTLGTAFTLDNKTAADILFDSINLWYYHSQFATDYFADLNYGAVEQATSSPAYIAMANSAKDG